MNQPGVLCLPPHNEKSEQRLHPFSWHVLCRKHGLSKGTLDMKTTTVSNRSVSAVPVCCQARTHSVNQYNARRVNES